MKYDLNEENEILCTEEGKPCYKVAVIDKNGDLRMSKGCAEHKEGVTAYLEARESAIAHEPEPEPTIVIPAPEVSAKALMEKRLEVGNEPLIPGAPPQDHRGDKTPEFARWLIANRPEEAAKRYSSIWSLNPRFPD